MRIEQTNAKKPISNASSSSIFSVSAERRPLWIEMWFDEQPTTIQIPKCLALKQQNTIKHSGFRLRVCLCCCCCCCCCRGSSSPSLSKHGGTNENKKKTTENRPQRLRGRGPKMELFKSSSSHRSVTLSRLWSFRSNEEEINIVTSRLNRSKKENQQEHSNDDVMVMIGCWWLWHFEISAVIKPSSRLSGQLWREKAKKKSFDYAIGTNTSTALWRDVYASRCVCVIVCDVLTLTATACGCSRLAGNRMFRLQSNWKRSVHVQTFVHAAVTVLTLNEFCLLIFGAVPDSLWNSIICLVFSKCDSIFDKFDAWNRFGFVIFHFLCALFEWAFDLSEFVSLHDGHRRVLWWNSRFLDHLGWCSIMWL